MCVILKGSWVLLLFVLPLVAMLKVKHFLLLLLLRVSCVSPCFPSPKKFNVCLRGMKTASCNHPSFFEPSITLSLLLSLGIALTNTSLICNTSLFCFSFSSYVSSCCFSSHISSLFFVCSSASCCTSAEIEVSDSCPCFVFRWNKLSVLFLCAAFNKVSCGPINSMPICLLAHFLYTDTVFGVRALGLAPLSEVYFNLVRCIASVLPLVSLLEGFLVPYPCNCCELAGLSPYFFHLGSLGPYPVCVSFLRVLGSCSYLFFLLLQC